MAETVKKVAAKAKESADKLASAVATATTRSGEPKILKPAPKPAPVKEEPVDVGARLDAFITYEKSLLAAVDIPDDTGDTMYRAVQAVIYHKGRIADAERAKKYLEEG